MNVVWLGLFSGIAFGFVIQRVGATNPDKMARAHLMIEPGIPQFMLTAVIFSALGVLGLQAFGVGTTQPLPLSIVATGLAGILFGLGWGVTGYCPGTTWAAAGEGRMDAVFALLGGLAGAAGFAQVQKRGYVEPPLVTAGADVRMVADFLPPDRDTYTAADVIRRLLEEPSPS